MKFLDRAQIRKAVTDSISGFLRAPATLTRTGVFQYVIDSNGEFVFGAAACGPGCKTIGVLRSPEEVFADASIASFEAVPLVDDHPQENGAVVNAENVKRLQVGSVGTPFRNGDMLDANVCVTDAAMIEKIRGGKVALSCGYFADTIDAPAGAMFEGIPYHKIQQNIRGNHLAVCDAARAGEKARMHLDSAVQVEETSSEVKKTLSQPGAAAPRTEKKNMEKIIVDGYTFEVEAQVAQAFVKQTKATAEILKANGEEITALKSKADKAQAVCDSTAAEVATLKTKIAALEAPAFIASKVAERVEIEKLASKHGITADGKDLLTVKREVIGKLNPAAKLEGKSADYVEAFFDSITAQAPTSGNVITDAAAKLIGGATQPVVVTDAAERSKKYDASFFGGDASKVTNRATPENL